MEVCLGIEPVMQPRPSRNSGGDCFACAMTAALRYLYPDVETTFDRAFELFREKYYQSEKTCIANDWVGLQHALDKACDEFGSLEVEIDIVDPRFNLKHFGYGWLLALESDRYVLRLEGWLRGGWVAFTQISFSGGGPLAVIDHFVLIDGVRKLWEPMESGGSSLNEYVHVVCSVKGAYWIRALDFLRNHGGAALMLCRREQY
ncbi:MAG: hypothetical protein ACM3ZC_13430 [Bacteroidota bacterium]